MGFIRRHQSPSEAQSEAQSDLHRAEDGDIAVAAADHSKRGISAEVRSAGQRSHLSKDVIRYTQPHSAALSRTQPPSDAISRHQRHSAHRLLARVDQIGILLPPCGERADAEHPVLALQRDRDAFWDEVAHLMWEAIICNQSHAERQSEVIRGHQRSSEVIRGHQRSSEVIRRSRGLAARCPG